MSNNALAFVAGLGTGFIKTKADMKERERQAKKDAQDEELHSARMYELNTGKKREEALAKAYEGTTVNEGAVTLDVSGKPVVYESADVAGSDYRQARALQDRAPIDTPAAQAGIAPLIPTGQIQANDAAVTAPAAMPLIAPAAPVAVIAPPKPTFAAGGLPYADKASAQKAADTYNSTDAGNQRAAKALRAMGDPAAAAALETSTRQGKLADIQLTKAEQEQVHDAAFREVTESFSRQGWNALPKIYENYNDGKTAKVTEDGKGGALVSVFDDKGKQVGQKAFKNEMEFITDAVAKLDPKIWVTMKQQQVKDERAQGNWEATHALAVDAKGETRRHNLATEGLAGQRLTRAGGGGGGSGRAGSGTGAAGDTVGFNALGNFDAKKAQDVAFSQASKAAEAAAAEGKPMTAAQQGKIAQDTYRAMEDSFANENTRRHVAGVVATELRAVQADPAQYAATFAKAKKLGMDDKTLASMGFKAPAGAAANPGSKAVTVANPIEQPASQAAAGIPQAAPAARAAPTQDQQIRNALGAGGNSSIDRIVGAKAPAIQAASSGLQQARDQLKAVARSGDPQALQLAAAKVQGARNAIDAIVKDMNKPQADAVRQAAGYFQ